MEIIQISLTDKQSKRIREESEILGSSIASIVRKALIDYFNSQERKHGLQ